MYRKVVLVALPSPWLISDRDVPPLGVLYLAAALRKHNIEVQIADLTGLPEEHWFIPEGNLYGVSFTTPQYPHAKQVIERLKQRGSTVVAGGPHVSALPVETLVNLGLDFAFVGEADESLVQLVKGESNENISGLVYRGNGHVKVNSLPVVEPESWHIPARDLVDIRSYHIVDTNRYIGQPRYEGYMITGRGCPFDCAFCAQPTVTGRYARFSRIDAVLDEVNELLYRYDCDLIYFEDDTFNLNRKRVLHLCESFKEIGLKWHCLCRADLVDAELLRAMHEAGCQNVTFGFESGSDLILERMNKKTTVAQNLQAAQWVQDAGMTVRAQMIVGFPGETDATIQETERFVREASVDKWGFHAFVPLPGSPVWNNPEAFGYELDKEAIDFSTGFHTIGKPGHWDDILVQNANDVRDWLVRLNSIVNDHAIHFGMEGDQIERARG